MGKEIWGVRDGEIWEKVTEEEWETERDNGRIGEGERDITVRAK